MRWYTENRRGWLVTNWSVRISGYPKLMDNIVVQTYPIHFRGAIGDRGFEAFSESGESLLVAYSTWVFADLENNKPLRPPIDIRADYGPEFPAPTERKMDFPLLTADDCPYYLDRRREFTVTRRDIDTNEHVNNVKYIEWAFDDIPEDAYKTARAREVKIIYKKQCRAGDIVLAEFYRRSDNPFSFVSLFKSADGDKAVFAEVYTLWR
jgi:medium-chain acyl-[acyl-carrier-protein] hydrolase